MRIYLSCASRLNTDLVSVSCQPSSKDDTFITETGNYIYEILRDHWVDSAHTDVGEKRSRMIEKFGEEHRARVLIEVRHRSGLPFIRLEIDRPDHTPRGALSMKLATDVREHLFKALSALIARNPQALADCVFMYDGKIVKESGDKIAIEQCPKS